MEVEAELFTENQSHLMYALDSHIKSLTDEELKEFYADAEDLLESLDCLSDQELFVLLEEKNRVIAKIEQENLARQQFLQAEQLLNDHLGKSMEVAGLDVDKPVELEF